MMRLDYVLVDTTIIDSTVDAIKGSKRVFKKIGNKYSLRPRLIAFACQVT